MNQFKAMLLLYQIAKMRRVETVASLFYQSGYRAPKGDHWRISTKGAAIREKRTSNYTLMVETFYFKSFKTTRHGIKFFASNGATGYMKLTKNKS